MTGNDADREDLRPDSHHYVNRNTEWHYVDIEQIQASSLSYYRDCLRLVEWHRYAFERLDPLLQ
ncbi:hypothetical protein C464_16877 [Halorubrum coriense DSM 10284]|uniref:Uncharacterized protein n=1 Tax=Halorubrum coriense DSM 10284 TaxID=1227466 RepID=M0E6J9_9EURY|nr:hypothetical protein C464_16877 [Halorubrum coriense DSM 10284]